MFPRCLTVGFRVYIYDSETTSASAGLMAANSRIGKPASGLVANDALASSTTCLHGTLAGTVHIYTCMWVCRETWRRNNDVGMHRTHHLNDQVQLPGK